VVSASPPQSGITLIEILNILEMEPLSRWGDYEENLATFHFMAEAMKRAYADRLHYLGDPLFVDVPTDILISKSFARSRYETIDPDRAVPPELKRTPYGDVSRFIENDAHEDSPDGSTSHISVVDRDGNAVALTQTLSLFWGSGISTCGFLLNDSYTGFSSTNPVNRASSRRQPRSTIAPTMVFKDDGLSMVVGSPGAGRILSTLAEFICHIIDFDKTVEDANAAPRFCARKWADTLPVEDRFPESLLEGLIGMGHPIEKYEKLDLFFGGVQAIVIESKGRVLIGSSDPRRSGSAAGY
jgi:gamma-glutamyltranspeptidase/glutathione hydrolase